MQWLILYGSQIQDFALKAISPGYPYSIYYDFCYM